MSNIVYIVIYLIKRYLMIYIEIYYIENNKKLGGIIYEKS